MIPYWLQVLSIIALLVAVACAFFIAADEMRRPQHMWIMNLVWPISALYAGPLVLPLYFRYGRATTHKMQSARRGKQLPAKTETETPFTVMVAKGSLHCGSGCTLGDLIAEWLANAVPGVAVAFGWQSILSEKMYAVWVLDFLLAFLFGIAFQYFTIKPMRDLSAAEGLVAAVKADTLSLSAWQIGMYGFMAIAQFYLFRTLLGVSLEANTPEFWFMMQIAMLTGFLTSYPVNWWLIEAGIKEKM